MFYSTQRSASQQVEFCTNAEAISKLKSALDVELIILDFDETIFLRNSTEEYLNCIQPRLLGALLLFTLSFLKPWNWLQKGYRGDVSRDWLRVLLITLVFPWTYLIWRFKSKELAKKFNNPELLNLLSSHPEARIVIASNGFRFILKPLVDELSISVQKLIACRFWTGSKDRKYGKKALLRDVLKEEDLRGATFVTDSLDDLPLLSIVANPCLTQWPDAKYVRAMGNLYIPFFYTERVKQPGENYVLKTVVAEDLLFVVLATSWVSSNPPIHAVGMAFLMAAFWCIYEIGYMENDLVAEKIEADPKLSDTYDKYKSRISLWQPWFWALLFSLPGVALLQILQVDVGFTPNEPLNILRNLSVLQVSLDLGKWMTMLVVLRVTFWAYNYVNKPTRIWLYPLLQIYKCFGFLVIASTNLVGSMFFAAQSIARWTAYLNYRFSKGEWRRVGQILRLIIFSILLLSLAFGLQDLSFLLSWQTLVIVVYSALKASRELRMALKDLGPIRDPLGSISKSQNHQAS